MDLTNEFTVPVPVERAWEVLNDVELIAPCLPGAQLQEIEGDEYRGIVKVKVGPITAQYKGAATFQEQDEANRRIVLKAEGRDTRGQGSASAIITATMTESGSGADVSTHVVVESDVTIKGKVAQFGRGMIAEVSAKLLTQFVECLEGKLDGEPAEAPADETPAETVGDDATEAAKAQAEPAASAAAEAEPAVRKVEHEASAPVDLLDSAGAPVAKRLAPLLAIVFLLLLLGKRRSKKRKR
ncbi:SRPBCC family protein [Actinospongicola halichondriae]|uniref:SRPBCC family protein n=1 Tax=Actinospongicola halichondriae TaxID=3236844 RepID=UPI003D4008F1